MKRIVISFIIFSFVFKANSQDLTLNSSQDASAFIGAYFSPLSQSIGAGLNSSWYHTAKPHKLGGFGVSLSLNMVSVPDQLRFFDVNQLDNFSSNSTSTPTILGEGQSGTITYQSNGISGDFILPDQDYTINAIPVPTLNAAVGLFKGTELSIRFIPSYQYDFDFIGNISVEWYGGGIKHDILQWIPLANKLPFDLSIQAAYSHFNTSFEIESQSTKQNVELNIDASTYNLILSKKFAILTTYGSLGISTINSQFEANTNFQLGSSQTLEFNVPIDFEFNHQSKIQATLGARIQLAIFTIFAHQTFSEQPISSAGIALGIR